MMNKIEKIENKLEIGIQQFSAQEVATLLNTIRIQQEQLNVAMKRLGIPASMMKERK